jgi:hypothetical protein
LNFVSPRGGPPSVCATAAQAIQVGRSMESLTRSRGALHGLQHGRVCTLWSRSCSCRRSLWSRPLAFDQSVASSRRRSAGGSVCGVRRARRPPRSPRDVCNSWSRAHSMVSGMGACDAPWSRRPGPPTRAPSPKRLASRPEVDRRRRPTDLARGAGVGPRRRSGATSCSTAKLSADQTSTEDSFQVRSPPNPHGPTQPHDEVRRRRNLSKFP